MKTNKNMLISGFYVRESQLLNNLVFIYGDHKSCSELCSLIQIGVKMLETSTWIIYSIVYGQFFFSESTCVLNLFLNLLYFSHHSLSHFLFTYFLSFNSFIFVLL